MTRVLVKLTLLRFFGASFLVFLQRSLDGKRQIPAIKGGGTSIVVLIKRLVSCFSIPLPVRQDPQRPSWESKVALSISLGYELARPLQRSGQIVRHGLMTLLPMSYWGVQCPVFGRNMRKTERGILAAKSENKCKRKPQKRGMRGAILGHRCLFFLF